MDHSLSTFLSGCAPFHDLIFFAKSLDEIDDDDQPNSTFFMLDDDKLSRFPDAVAWPAISQVTIKPEGGLRILLALGPNGETWEGFPSNAAHSSGRIGIGDFSWRSLSLVDGEIYACGMNRALAMRTGPHRWRSVSAPEGKESEGICGFEDLDGFSSSDLYAAGWQGEIWQRKGERWRQIDSPVSANLNALCCCADGWVYVVGDAGVMLRGRDDEWREIDTGCSENLQDVRDFDGTIYVTTDFEILALRDDTLASVTNFADPEDLPDTCLYLLKGENGLISLGPKDLFKLIAGAWQRVV
jgi:hypothetical protein